MSDCMSAHPCTGPRTRADRTALPLPRPGAAARDASPGRRAAGLRRLAPGIASLAALAALVLAAGCAVEVQNTKPAQELQAARTRPPGSVYTGWRVYVDRCAGCHGVDAAGSGNAPDLLARVRSLGPGRFVNLVLRRYEWNLPSPPPAADGAARDAAVEDIVQRRAGQLTMPAWQGEPRVTAHIADLYAYLSARAEGTVGPGRPAP